jgi:hypothetical protein
MHIVGNSKFPMNLIRNNRLFFIRLILCEKHTVTQSVLLTNARTDILTTSEFNWSCVGHLVHDSDHGDQTDDDFGRHGFLVLDERT